MKNILKKTNSKMFLLFLIAFLSHLGYGQGTATTTKTTTTGTTTVTEVSEYDEVKGVDGKITYALTKTTTTTVIKDVVKPVSNLTSSGTVPSSGGAIITGSGIPSTYTSSSGYSISGNGSISGSSWGDGSVSGSGFFGSGLSISSSSSYTISSVTSIGGIDNSLSDTSYFGPISYPNWSNSYSIYNEPIDVTTVVVVTDQNVSSSISITIGTTPCDELKALNSNPDYKAKIALLKGNTGLKYETGVIQRADGTFQDYIPGSDPNHLDPPPGTNFKGGIHTHIDPYESGKFRTDGTPIMLVPIPMFSPQDIHQFLETLVNTKLSTNSVAPSDVYSTFVSSSGTYTLKFTGNINDVSTNFNWGTDLDDKYKLAIKENDKELGFLKFLKDNIGINGISLYKVNDDGTSENKSLDANNLLQTNPCQ